MFFRLTPGAWAVFLCLHGVVMTAMAQESEKTASPPDKNSHENTTLPAVTVTAKGYAAQDAETPIATSVVTRNELAKKGAQNLGDALRGEPGLAVSSDSAQGQNPVIRGLKKDSVVLLVDGMRLNSAQPAGAVSSFMSLGLAEQVEVVKGPASVLYGTGALGGAINVRLPQARFEPGLGFRGGLVFDTASRGVRATPVMNLSIGNHAWMLGASQARMKDYTTPDGRVLRTGYDSDAFIGQYRYRIDAAQQLRLSVQQHRDDDVWYPGSTRPHPVPAVGSTTLHSPTQQRRLYEIGYSHSRADQRPWGWDVRLYRQEMQRTIYSFGNKLGRDIVTNRVNFATDGFDAKAEWLAHPQHLLSFGLNTWQMQASPDRYQAVPPAFTQFVPNYPFQQGKMRALGLYVQDDMQFGNWRVLAGLRHDRVSGNAASMSNGAVTQGLQRSDAANSGSLGLMYEVSPLLRPYVHVARAFRAADMRERYESGLRGDGSFHAGSPQIAPETATQFEVGAKGGSDTLEYGVSLYRNRITNYITGLPLTGAAAVAACGATFAATCKKTVNLGSVTLQGAEAKIRWQAFQGHWLSAVYSYVRGTNHDLHEPLYQVPADSLTLGWEGALTPQWTLDAQAHLVARQTRVATGFSRATENATPGYGVLDVGATWRYNPNQSLRVAVKNLGHKRYHEHLAEGLPGQEIKSPGRSLLVSWQISF